MQVTDTGENVYSDPVEAVLRRQDHVAEALVIAEGRKYVTALVQPNLDALLQSEVDEANRELAEYERVQKIRTISRGFSVEREELTRPSRSAAATSRSTSQTRSSPCTRAEPGPRYRFSFPTPIQPPDSDPKYRPVESNSMSSLKSDIPATSRVFARDGYPTKYLAKEPKPAIYYGCATERLG